MNPDILRERAKIVSAIRRFFDERGFIEVETAVRIPAPAPEEHIDCPPVVGGGYLRASPELQMKKLLAAGMDKIYQIGPCFREGEKGSRHNPEFTMLEWYRKNATYLDIKCDLENLLNTGFSTGASAGRSASQSPDGSVFKVLKVRDAYLQYAGWDPWEGAWDQNRFDFDMATKIEPAIKSIGGGVFLMDYPPQAASLAKISHPFAERWEFYWEGLELANCFTELCDSDEQRLRFEAARKSRILLKESEYPIDNEFIECLPRIGSAAGVALGVDRLVMVLTKTKEIPSVRASL
jgi:lysyl-tRNA synthetase class 2